jgi:hypothetical protein
MSDRTDSIHCDEAEFFRLLSDPGLNGTFFVRFANGEIPVRLQRGTTRDLVITFHGAIRRERDSIPRFAGFNAVEYVDATIVGFADPSLSVSETLPCAWYAGHEGFETQTILGGFLDRLIEELRPPRPVFLGGSAGGFAALLFSHRYRNSVAVALNPQVDIERYLHPNVEYYRKDCRPSLPADVSLQTVIVSNLAAEYGTSFENVVIYLQNCTDRSHIKQQMTPFLNAIEPRRMERLLVKVGFWGGMGHSVIPSTEWGPWVAAALQAPEHTADSILLAFTAAMETAASRTKTKDPQTLLDRKLAAILAKQAHEEL